MSLMRIDDVNFSTVAPGDIVEYDVSDVTRQLCYVRFAEYSLIWYGLRIPMMLVIFFSLDSDDWPTRTIVFLICCLFGGICVASYLSAGHLRPKIWRWYPLLLPLAFVIALLLSLPDDFDHLGQSAPGFLAAVLIAIGVVPAIRLRAAKILPMNRKATDLLTSLDRRRSDAKASKRRGHPANRNRGILLLTLGFILASTAFWALGFILLLKARQYFQVAADSLLADDKRAPILFLRSFADDPDPRPFFARRDERAPFYLRSLASLARWIDFSIETRLANHFTYFGPFITVRSPRDSVPLPGAARVKLTQEAWQETVRGWIGGSRLILMFAGVTHWVNWELAQVLNAGVTAKLIVFFPRPKLDNRGIGRKFTSFLARRKESARPQSQATLSDRFEQIKAALADTPWTDAWAQITAPDTIIAVYLEETGGIMLIRSKRRNNDAYQLAAEILHLRILDGHVRQAGDSNNPVLLEEIGCTSG
jgi:hypothetical protein